MADQEEQENRRISTYPLDPTSYKLLQVIGTGVSATVYKASCLPINSSIVAIKAIDLERSRANLDDVRREAKAMTLLSHPNILRAHCSFTVDHHLWVVMPFMSAGSLHSIISSSFPNGLSEFSIAFVLKETLNALLYLHDQGHLHRDIKAGNILVDSDGTVKLADFGVSASIYEPNSSQSSMSLVSSSSKLMFNELAGTPYWMAPEVIHSHIGYSFKADIWSFGITALELAHGRPPLSHLPPWKSLFMRITNRLRLADYEKNKMDKNKKFSKNFRDMVASCLSQDPSKRPTAEKLLKHPFFRNCNKGVDFLVKNVLQGLPTVEERYRESLKCHGPSQIITIDGEKVEDVNADDDDGSDEESLMAPVEKHRRISGWNFNEEVLELYPVFPIEQRDHQVSNRDPPSLDDEIEKKTVNEEVEIKGEEEKEEIGEMKKFTETDRMVAVAPLVPNLESLMESLEMEKRMVSELINKIRGSGGGEMVDEQRRKEEKLQEMVKQLNFELEQERRKSFVLETELESLRCTVHSSNGNKLQGATQQ